MEPETRNRKGKPTSPLPAESLTQLASIEATDHAGDRQHRRLTYLMAFRVLLISLVMGATTLLYWLGDVDLTTANALALYGVIGATYGLTLVYAYWLRSSADYQRMARYQVLADLLVASVIVHFTGGAQSAYTFFYPFAIIGAAAVQDRRGALTVTVAAALLFAAVAVLGWMEVLPVPSGQHLRPGELSSLELARALALNLAAIAGIGALAYQLATQLQETSKDLEVHRSAAADLLSLQDDIVRCLTSGLVTVDLDGRITTMNDAAAEILSCEADEAVGKELSSYSTELASLLAHSPADRRDKREEVRSEGPRGTVILGVSVSPLYDHTSAITGRILNFQDLTEIRKLEQDMKRSERLSVVGQLAANVAHEIRNPLASISGSIELLGASPQADEDSQALMNIVQREVERLNTLIAELLDYSNPRPLRPADIDLAEVVQDTLRVFAQDEHFGDVELSFDAADEELKSYPLRADPEKIRQLLWNLLRNGAEAALQGGKQVRVGLQKLDGHHLLEVEDNGPGIPENMVESIFDPFMTSKSKGSGLGLATVQSIVADHNGEIRVSSEPGKGAVFQVKLPYTSDHDD